MAEMKVALLDRRFGTHGGHEANRWMLRKGGPKVGLSCRGENTFSFIDAFGEAMTGSIENASHYHSLADYDIIYMRVRTPPNEIPSIKRIREACPNTKLIAYTDEWVNFDIIEKMNRYKFKELSENVDAITCGFGKKYSEKMFKEMGITNYYHLPYAGDVEFWKTKYKPFSKKGNYITGMWHLRSFMGQGTGNLAHTDTFKVLQYLCQKHSLKAKFFLNFDGRKHVNYIRDKIKGMSFECELLEHVGNSEFDEIMSKSLLFYEEYPTPAYSRATVVSACVGTPSISNYLNDPSRVCFPDLTIENMDIETAKKMGDRLLSDKTYWKEQAKLGYNNVEYYNYPAFKDRIIQLVDTL